TSRSEAKLERCRELGMHAGVVPGKRNEFAAHVRELTAGRGADIVLELVGGDYVPESLAAMSEKGRLVLVGLLAGTRAEIDLALVLRRRLRIFGTVLRARPLEQKIVAAQTLAHNLAPLFASGTL